MGKKKKWLNRKLITVTGWKKQTSDRDLRLQIQVEQSVDWSIPQEVDTRYGPRILRKAIATEKFLKLWSERPRELKALGVSYKPDSYTGEWQLMWWIRLQ